MKHDQACARVSKYINNEFIGDVSSFNIFIDKNRIVVCSFCCALSRLSSSWQLLFSTPDFCVSE